VISQHSLELSLLLVLVQGLLLDKFTESAQPGSLLYRLHPEVGSDQGRWTMNVRILLGVFGIAHFKVVRVEYKSV